MIWRVHRFGYKNFKNHMDISNNITLRGMIRRQVRRYPKTYQFAKGCSTICALYFLVMNFIPGSNLPLQKNIKLSILSFSNFTSRLLFYNIIAPQPEEYLIKLNETILLAFDWEIFDNAWMNGYFDLIREVVQQQKKQLKNQSYLDILLYSQLILQNIIRYQKRLLLEKDLLSYYEWIYLTVFSKLKGTTLTSKEDKHIRLTYTVIAYLINFGPKQHLLEYLKIYQTSISQQYNSTYNFGYLLKKQALKEQNFIAIIKQIYQQGQSQQIKDTIISIFQKINAVFQEYEVNQKINQGKKPI